MKRPPGKPLLSVAEAAEALRVSESTVWRLLRHGELASVQRSGRRLVPAAAVARRASTSTRRKLRPLGPDHPMWKLIGAFKSGGAGPGSSDKYRVLFGE